MMGNERFDEDASLFRFLKSSKINKDINIDLICDKFNIDIEKVPYSEFCSVESLCKRDSEEFVSLYWSEKESDKDKIISIINTLPMSISAKSGFMKIDSKRAYKYINDTEIMIQFVVDEKSECSQKCVFLRDSPLNVDVHFGLDFIKKDAHSILEIISSLMEISEFFLIKRIAKDPYKGEIYRVNDGMETKLIGTVCK